MLSWNRANMAKKLRSRRRSKCPVKQNIQDFSLLAWMCGSLKRRIMHIGNNMAQTVIEGTSMFTSSEIFTIYIKQLWTVYILLHIRSYIFIPTFFLSFVSRKFRYIAYRQLVRWCWGYLGRKVRVALPSCAVNKIRQRFPADFGTSYTGLKPPNLQ